MKLNDKSLSRYAASGAPPEKEGYLHKRGDFNKGYQKRWCVLKGNLLFYYEKRTDKDPPIGVIVLEGCTIELSDHADGFTFMIHFPGSGSRTYVMSADTQEEMEEWMKVLSSASYDYMKVCVNDLKNKLQELSSNNNRTLLQNAVLSQGSSGQRSSGPNSSTMYPREPAAMGTSQGSGMSSSSSSHSLGMRRHNPFDTDDSMDREDSAVYETEKHSRTFLEMHEEFRDQIKEITESWRQQQTHTAVARQLVNS